jgi:hypothetical protein
VKKSKTAGAVVISFPMTKMSAVRLLATEAEMDTDKLVEEIEFACELPEQEERVRYLSDVLYRAFMRKRARERAKR